MNLKLIACVFAALLAHSAAAADEERSTAAASIVTSAEIVALADALNATDEISSFTVYLSNVSEVADAAPRKLPDTWPYPREFRAFLDDCKLGGKIVRFDSRQAVDARGFALLREGKVVRTVVTAVH